ncbi:hypothetical protein QVD17_19608 [Tagetes erecta]|uniref:Uncharacterized protein n=1 Tax=Tagetes erecta TaxID=13708 RepID=A0AAD8KML7_TARER|nr:hypothetical protein QVD17_19608 [Tagetes erecta]
MSRHHCRKGIFVILKYISLSSVPPLIYSLNSSPASRTTRRHCRRSTIISFTLLSKSNLSTSITNIRIHPKEQI